MKRLYTLFLIILSSIITTQPNARNDIQSFESTFNTGSNVYFVENWKGNEVSTSKRIYQGDNPRSGEKSLNIITTSSFEAVIQVSLNLDSIEFPSASFYAYSQQNGSSTSTRPAILKVSLSTDGGISFSNEQQIGDDRTFPNDDSTEYKKYSYDISIEPNQKDDVVIKLSVERGDGQGSSAELVIDDFQIISEIPQLDISSFTAISGDSLSVKFNQAIRQNSAEDSNNYTLDNGAVIKSATLFEKNEVLLILEEPLLNNTYNLLAGRIESLLSEEVSTTLEASIQFETPTKFRDIAINEIFADPNGDYSPSQSGLPTESQAEFIELYNNSKQAIDISGFDLSGGTIQSFVLKAESHVIITSTANYELYKEFGTVATLSSWNALSNSGEQITLKDNLGNIVDTVNYDLNWYQNTDKSAGGWTLEQINPNLSCSDLNNWEASTDSLGGTPGKINSNFSDIPDTIEPKIIRIEVLSNQRVVPHFNESMDKNSLINADYRLEHQNESIPIENTTASFRQVEINLTDRMVSGRQYTLSITGATDCSGNKIEASGCTFLFDDEGPVINHIVLRDSISIEVQFNEPIDQTASLDAQDFQLESQRLDVINVEYSDTNSNQINLSSASGFKLDSTYTLIYTNVSDTLENRSINKFFDFIFEDHLDTVEIISSQLINLVFKQDLNQNSTEEIHNYALGSDAQNPLKAVLDSENRNRVHLILDQSLPENKSVGLSFNLLYDKDSNRIQALNRIITFDTKAPSVDSVKVINEKSIELFISERIDVSSAENTSNYLLNRTTSPIKATLENQGASVILDFSEEFIPETEYQINISDISDLWGNKRTSSQNRDFVFDQQPPSLVSLQVISPKKLSLTLSESLDSTTAFDTSNYLVSNGIDHPKHASLSVRDDRIIHLEFESLGNNEFNILEIKNLQDLRGNIIRDSIISSFTTLTPRLSEIAVQSGFEIQLQFSKELTRSSASNPYNYVTGGDASIVRVDLDSLEASIVRLFFESPIQPGKSYPIQLKNLADTYGNSLEVLDTIFSYNNPIQDIKVLSKNSIYISFSTELDLSIAELTQNYEVNNELGNPLLIEGNEDDPNGLLLFFKKAFQPNLVYTISINGLKDRFGEDIPGVSARFVYDTTSPGIESIQSVYLNEIEVVFSEALDIASATTLNHFILSQNQLPQTIKIDSTQKIVKISFKEGLTDGSSYTLYIHRVKDLQGNEIISTAQDFIHEAPRLPEFRDIVINEVYFETASESYLPEFEFIELFNRSDGEILLTDFVITDRSDTAFLPSINLLSEEHIILTKSSGENAYRDYGNTMGIEGFPSLSNTGETVWLLDRNMTIVDSLLFNRSSYNDTLRNNGGFSLELINPFKHCFDDSNYGASTSATGGTPGRSNELLNISLDDEKPNVSSFEVISSSQLRLGFSEAMDVTSLEPASFFIDTENSIAQLNFIGSFGKSIDIILDQPFRKGELVSMEISNVFDCSRNNRLDTTIYFSKGIEPTMGDLVITEIMANPIQEQELPNAEYLEVLNKSEKIISMHNLVLADGNNSTILNDFDLKPNEYLLLVPSSASDEFSFADHLLPVTNWPSLNNSADKVALYTLAGTELISISYDDSWYTDTEKANGGISLEMIDPDYPCLLANNWNASESSTGGTPGDQNSINAENPDVIGPKILSAIALNSSTILIEFDEQLSVQSIEIIDFSGDQGLSFLSFLISEDKRSITLFTEEDLQENSIYQILIENITDCSGNLIDTNASSARLIVAGIPSPKDILVNEILFNPRSGGVRFVEIYNQSNKYINLKNWVLQGGTNQVIISESNLFINPQEYFIVTNDENILATHYPNSVMDNLITVRTLPSFPSDKGEVGLLDHLNNEIDYFEYDEEFHSPFLKILDGVSLERLKFISATNNSNNWFSAAANENYATPGYVNSQSISDNLTSRFISVEPVSFAPNTPGADNFTTINYRFESPGNVIDIKILSADGRMVKQVAKNTLVGREGFFRWDGSNDSGGKARIGYYIVLCTVIGTDSEVKKLVEKVAIGGRFNP